MAGAALLSCHGIHPHGKYMGSWPFKEPQDLEVSTARVILCGEKWIYYVAHDLNGSWKFLPEGHLSMQDEDRACALLKEMVLLDARLFELCELPPGWHAWRRGEDAPWERVKQPQGNIFFFQFEATPRQSHPESGEIAGAFVNCWIDGSSLVEADAIARRTIEDDGWIVADPDEAYSVTAADYDEDADGLDYYKQSLIDGLVCVFHTYPVDEEDDDDDAPDN
ncbi:MAG: hypothetical protein IIB58_08795 [Planctomycetes bacterium]|nr:hypothetical protein [Planctomycetota bacterium]